VKDSSGAKAWSGGSRGIFLWLDEVNETDMGDV
jgi:hypothetical protein